MKKRYCRSDFADETIQDLTKDEYELFKEACDQYNIHHISIKKDVQRLQFKKGEYISIECPKICDGNVRKIVSLKLCMLLYELEKKLKIKPQKFLVVGLGNKNITSDAFGPMVVSSIVATSHYYKMHDYSMCEGTRNVATFIPGVMGQTGLESLMVTKALLNVFQPDCIILLDALATSDRARLHHVIQMNTVGLSPGSGVGNYREEISYKTCHVPVISIGVATVMSIANFMQQYLIEEGTNEDFIKSLYLQQFQDTMITLKGIDEDLRWISEIVSYGLNLYLHPSFENL